METANSDHVCPGQIDHDIMKRMIIITEYLLLCIISHADYHLIDICIFITLYIYIYIYIYIQCFARLFTVFLLLPFPSLRVTHCLFWPALQHERAYRTKSPFAGAPHSVAAWRETGTGLHVCRRAGWESAKFHFGSITWPGIINPLDEGPFPVRIRFSIRKWLSFSRHDINVHAASASGIQPENRRSARQSIKGKKTNQKKQLTLV